MKYRNPRRVSRRSATSLLSLLATLGIVACSENAPQVSAPPATPQLLTPQLAVVTAPAMTPLVEQIHVCKTGPAGTYSFTADVISGSVLQQNGVSPVLLQDADKDGHAAFTVDAGTCLYIGLSGGPTRTIRVTELAHAGTQFVSTSIQQLTNGTVTTTTGGNPSTANLSGAPLLEGAVITFVNADIVPPNLTINKTADAGTVSAGSNIGFGITVTNTGGGTANNVTLSDPLPTGPGLNWSIDTQPAQGSCAIASGTLSCAFGNLAAGASVSVHLTSPTTAASCGSLFNTATASADNNAQVASTASVDVECPSLTITKTADAASVPAGNNIGFGITVGSTGPGTASNVTLSDPLPTGSGLSWSIDGQPGQGSCSIASNTLSCAFGNMAAGSSVTVHLSSPTTSASCGQYSNTATATADNGSPVSSTAATSVVCPTSVGETATGAGFPWKATQGAPNNWFMYSPWVTTGSYRGISETSAPAGTALIAGQIYQAGRITGTRGGGANSTSITITLNSGFSFTAIGDNVKINPMSCTTAQPYVQPGQFVIKRTASASGNTITITGLPNTACYGVHADVQRQLP